MEIISAFVREQQHYTKSQLRTLFCYDDAGIERFIKNLRAYGILKTAANSAEQRELTELTDEDIQVTDEAPGNDGCYVFTYVGVVTAGRRVIKVYPKYIPAHREPLAEMKQVLKVLERYSRSEEQIVSLFSGDGEHRGFNLLAVILYLLRDYFEYGVYHNTEDILEVNGEGDILWDRTVDSGFAVIESGRPYYPEFITRRSVEDETDYFRRLHECVLTECSRQLHDAGLEDLFDLETVSLSEESLDDFGGREYMLDRITRELNVQFNTHRQILLKTLRAYIAQDRKMLEDEQGISMFGTTAFHAVWEKACAAVFGSKLGVPLGQLSMNAPLAPGYDRQVRLIDLMEKPKWCGGGFVREAKDTLIPDLITVARQDGQDWFVIFDAKYYLLQLEQDRPLEGNPGIGDVVKQYIYQLAYRNFIADHRITTVKNCFLLPTEGTEIVSKGTVRLDMLAALGLEDIQIRLIPAGLLFDRYLNGGTIELEALDL